MFCSYEIAQPLASSACRYSWPTMNSSVKSFVPNVSDFPDELRVVADVLGAAGRDEPELEPLLLPHAASSIAASRASAPAARIRGSRLDTGLDDGPRIVVFSSM